MNIQRKNSAHHFRMQSEREQTLAVCLQLVNKADYIPCAWLPAAITPHMKGLGTDLWLPGN